MDVQNLKNLPQNRPLSHVLVLDLAVEQASHCSRLLAGLGARVIRIEKQEGSPSKVIPPRTFLPENSNQRSAEIDLRDPEGKRAFHEWIRRADVLVETFAEGSPEAIDFSPQRLRRRNPSLIRLSITPFGRTRPQSSDFSGDLLNLPGCQPYQIASLFGAVSILIRLRRRRITGRGGYLDLSVHEAVASMLEHELAELGDPSSQREPDFSLLRCRDGYVQIPIVRSWNTLVELMASENKAGDLLASEWQDGAYCKSHFDQALRIIEAWTRDHSRRELFGLGQTMGFPWASVDTIEEVRTNPQLLARKFFVSAGENSEAAIPGLPFKFRALPFHQPESAPHQGERSRAIFTEIAHKPRERTGVPSQSTSCPDGKIFSGTRVIDLTRMISGPYATRILADFGAEVLKIQCERTASGAEQNNTPFFSIWNRNKRSLNLDLDLPAARESFLELVAGSDILLENFSPRVMVNWELHYERLAEVNPGLIMVSISAMGQTGPWKDFIGFAPNFHALSGLISAVSAGTDAPADIGYPYADLAAGLYAALAALSALEFRDKTGIGLHIDLSALEAICAFDHKSADNRYAQHAGRDLMEDIRLTARKFFVELRHPVLGSVVSARTPLWDWRQRPRWKPSPQLNRKP